MKRFSTAPFPHENKELKAPNSTRRRQRWTQFRGLCDVLTDKNTKSTHDFDCHVKVSAI